MNIVTLYHVTNLEAFHMMQNSGYLGVPPEDRHKLVEDILVLLKVPEEKRKYHHKKDKKTIEWDATTVSFWKEKPTIDYSRPTRTRGESYGLIMTRAIKYAARVLKIKYQEAISRLPNDYLEYNDSPILIIADVPVDMIINKDDLQYNGNIEIVVKAPVPIEHIRTAITKYYWVVPHR